jgi:hypothetical protein
VADGGEKRSEHNDADANRSYETKDLVECVHARNAA